MTVGFDLHHVHFGTPWEPVAEEDVRDACEYIEKLMSGEYRIAVWSRNGEFVQSETSERGIDQWFDWSWVTSSWLAKNLRLTNGNNGVVRGAGKGLFRPLACASGWEHAPGLCAPGDQTLGRKLQSVGNTNVASS
jgi:hypothetical protein